MNEKKKTYQKPVMSVIRLEKADLICTSGRLRDYDGYEWEDN